MSLVEGAVFLTRDEVNGPAVPICIILWILRGN